MRKTVKEKANLGQAIAFFRRKKGITQIRLAELCDIKNAFISKLENGAKYPTPELMEKITFNLDISREDLLNKAFLLDDDSLSPKQIQELQKLKKLVDEFIDRVDVSKIFPRV